MRTRSALFNSTDVQGGCFKVHLVRSVSRPLWSLDLGLGQVLPGPQVAIAASPRGNCSFYDGRRDQLEVPLTHVIGPPRSMTVRIMILF